MEYKKINLLGDTPSQTSKFRTRIGLKYMINHKKHMMKMMMMMMIIIIILKIIIIIILIIIILITIITS